MTLGSTVNFLRLVFAHPLNQKRKKQAFFRWLNWHIGSRLVPGPVAVPFVDESLLLIEPGLRGATENIYTGLTDFEDMSFLLHFLQPDDLFVDVGANVGAYTILASAVCHSRCISIEPIKKSFSWLKKNVNLNDVSSLVNCHNIGIGDSEGTLRFTSQLDCVNHVVADDENNNDFVEVKVSTLDNLLGEDIPSLIKIDVEGFESKVLAGAKSILKSDRLLGIILELNGSGHRYGYSDEIIDEIMKDNDFLSFTYSPFSRKLELTNDINTEGRNTIYLRNVDIVQKRLSEAQKFNVNGVKV
jgi:FkbM family methyltransferase